MKQTKHAGRYRAAHLVTVALCLQVVGCHSEIHSLAEGERLARERDATLLIFFKDHLDPASARMERILATDDVGKAEHGMVHYTLLSAYTPNWQAMSRYGVYYCPAIVLLFPDGTFETLVGEHDAESVAAFLVASQAPGHRPQEPISYDDPTPVTWIPNYSAASERARRSQRPLLVFFRSWSSEPSLRVWRLLETPLLRQRLRERVCCALDVNSAENQSVARALGIHGVPALFEIGPSGESRRLIAPETWEELEAFLVPIQPAE